MFEGLSKWPSTEDPFPNEFDMERIKGRMEPWMSDFMKERHSKNDWDALFYYVEAGPLKRIWIQMCSSLLSIFHKDRGTS